MKVVSVFCTNCGAAAQLDLQHKGGFCSYCGSQLIIDNEEKKIVHSGHISIDGTPTLESWIHNVNAFKKLGLYAKANDLLMKITHEYPGDYQAWWIYAEDYLLKPYEILENRYGESNTLHFSKSEYFKLNERINAPMRYIKNALIVASPEKRKELGKISAEWVGSFIPYFELIRKRTLDFYGYIEKYEEACKKSENKYLEDKKNHKKYKTRISLLLWSLIVLSIVGCAKTVETISNNSLLFITSAICLLVTGITYFILSGRDAWKKLADKPWSWYRANEISSTMLISEEQYLHLFEGERIKRFRNDEYIEDVYFKFVKISDIDVRSDEIKNAVQKFSNN